VSLYENDTNTMNIVYVVSTYPSDSALSVSHKDPPR